MDKTTLSLDQAQLDASTAPIHRPCLINAGPGAGKTTTLIARVLHLLQQGLHPHHIYLITFTNEALRSFRDRLLDLQHSTHQNSLPKLKTIDALIAELCDSISPRQRTKVTDQKEYLKLIKEELQLADDKSLSAYYRGEPCPDLSFNIFEKLSNLDETNYRKGLYTHQSRRIHLIRHLKADPHLRTEIRKRFQHILVDEFQDVNNHQAEIIRLLTTEPGSPQAVGITVVGDDDQSIYQFQGGNPEILGNFLNDYTNAMRFDLTVNYRSIDPIVLFSSSEIEKLGSKRMKQHVRLRARPTEQGNQATNASGVVSRVISTNMNSALNYVSEFVRNLRPPSLSTHPSILVLTRTNDVVAQVARYLEIKGFRVLLLKPKDESSGEIKCEDESVEKTGDSEITVCTIHKSKGLESDAVCVLLEHRVASWKRNQESSEKDQDDEARLRYVAYTRARRLLTIIDLDPTLPVNPSVESENESEPTKPRTIERDDPISEKEYREMFESDSNSTDMTNDDDTTVDDTTTNSTSASNLAEWFHHFCPRKLCRSSRTVEKSSSPVEPVESLLAQSPPFDPVDTLSQPMSSLELSESPRVQSIVDRLKDAGNRWESHIVWELYTRKKLFHDAQKDELAHETLLEILSNMGQGEYIHEPKIRPDNSLDRLVSLPQTKSLRLKMRNLIPDFLKIQLKIDPDGTQHRSAQILDAKFTKSSRAKHKVQVALYAMYLTEIIRRSPRHRHRMTVHEKGALWIPRRRRDFVPEDSEFQSSFPELPVDIEDCIVEFPIRPVLHSLSRFLRVQLPQIYEAGEPEYHIRKTCIDCEYFRGCHDEAKENRDLSLVRGISVQMKKKLIADGIGDIEDLVNGLETRKDLLKGENVRAEILENAKAVLSQKVRFLDRRSMVLPIRETHQLIFSFVRNPLNDVVLMGGMKHACFERVPSVSKDHFYTSEDLAYPRKLVDDIHRILHAAHVENKASVYCYFFSTTEYQSLAGILLRVFEMASDGGDGMEETKRKTSDILRSLVLDLGILPHVIPSDPVLAEPRTVVLENEIQLLAVLPDKVTATFDSYYDATTGSTRPIDGDRTTDALVVACLERRDTEMRERMDRRLTDVSEILTGLRSKIPCPETQLGEPVYFTFEPPMAVRDPIFLQLLYHRSWSLSLSMSKLRSERTSCIPSATFVPQRKSCDEGNGYIGILENGAIQFEVDGKTSFPQQVLIAKEEDRDAMRLLWKFDDCLYLDRDFVTLNDVLKSSSLRAGSIVLIESSRPENDETCPVILNTNVPLSIGKKYHVFKRLSDFSLKRLCDHVKRTEKKPSLGEAFLKLMKGGEFTQSDDECLECWKTEIHPNGGERYLKISENVETGGLTDAHVRIMDLLRRKNAVLCVGPPGSGKTHFLSTVLLSRLYHARTVAKVQTVIVLSAFTHSAIDNVIRNMDRLCIGSTDSPMTRVIRLANDASLQEDGGSVSGVQYVSRTELMGDFTARVLKTRQCVIAGTVWQLDRFQGPLSSEKISVDMICLDESSQLPALESAIPLSFLSPAKFRRPGSTFLVGDHKQLGTIRTSGKGAPCFSTEATTSSSSVTSDEDSMFRRMMVRAEVAKDQSVNWGTLTVTRRLNDVVCSFIRRTVGYDGYVPEEAAGKRRLVLLKRNAERLLRFVESSFRSLTLNEERQQRLRNLTLKTLDPDLPLVAIVLRRFRRETSMYGREEEVEAAFATVLLQCLIISTEGERFSTCPEIRVLSTSNRKRHRVNEQIGRVVEGSERLKKIAVTTVHKAQGRECDVAFVLFGTHEASEEGGSRQETEFLSDPALLNVALTRGRVKSVVLLPEASVSLWGSLSGGGSGESEVGFGLVQEFLVECERRNALAEVEMDDLSQVIRVR